LGAKVTIDERLLTIDGVDYRKEMLGRDNPTVTEAK
jgi:hypothetical protein